MTTTTTTNYKYSKYGMCMHAIMARDTLYATPEIPFSCDRTGLQVYMVRTV